MEEKQKLICSRCKVEMELRDATFSYLERTFQHKVMRCPQCGQVHLPEELVKGRMSQVESAMEDK